MWLRSCCATAPERRRRRAKRPQAAYVVVADAALAVTILISAEGLETDLSGFKFRSPDLLTERAREALLLLADTLESRFPGDETNFSIPSARKSELNKGKPLSSLAAAIIAGTNKLDRLSTRASWPVGPLARALRKVNVSGEPRKQGGGR